MKVEVALREYPDLPPERCFSCSKLILAADSAIYYSGAWFHEACYHRENGETNVPNPGSKIPPIQHWVPEMAQAIVREAMGITVAPRPRTSGVTSLPNSRAARKARTGPKDPLAVELGRRGGLKGGKARAQKLSAEQRRTIATRAARARWKRAG